VDEVFAQLVRLFVVPMAAVSLLMVGRRLLDQL
jgi:hypothetical protein